MIHAYEIAKTLERMTVDYQRHTKLKEELKSKIAQLPTEGRTKSWETEQTKALRDIYIPKMNEIMIKLNQDYEPIAKHKSAWESREYCLSQIAVSDTGADRVTPANMHTEAVVRQAIIGQGNLMSNETLKIAFEDAINDKQEGKAVIYAAIGNSRTPSAKIDTSKIELPFQKVALEKYRAINSIIGNAILDLREAGGARADTLATARLTAARGESIE